jgi:outer membrane protein assembly factor BamD
MFCRAIITVVVGVMLMSLGSAGQSSGQNPSPVPSQAQNSNNDQSPSSNNTQAQNANNSQAQNANNAQAQNANNAQAQNTNNQAKKSKQTKKKQTAANNKSKKKTSTKAQNPIANVDSKQPDKVLFDRAMDAMKHNKYDVARLSLQTLINTYPDSEYIARAKLAIGDSWYQEGGAAAMAQAESEYKDFITFFPNMPEAAEAQMKIADIHYREMEKADRDPTHARRAEEEYRQLIMQFPDSKLVPQAKQRLLEVQEVLGQREYLIGHFYFVRESYPAAIARLKSVADTYPLYSGADQALYELGTAYERECDLIRRSKLPENSKGVLLKQYTASAAEAYDRILTRYPLEERAGDAKKRLEAMKQPVPKATPQAIAQDKAEIASRGSTGTIGKVMENFHKGPDVTEATKVGEPTLVDPKQASAPDLVRAFTNSVTGSLSNLNGTGQVSVERVDTAAPPAENAPVPRSDAALATAGGPAVGGPTNGAPASGNTNSVIPELQNDLQPAPAGVAAGAPEKPPAQVNDAAASSSSPGSGSQSAATTGSSSSTQAQAAPANPNTESSSKKKKKKILGIF